MYFCLPFSCALFYSSIDIIITSYINLPQGWFFCVEYISVEITGPEIINRLGMCNIRCHSLQC